MLKFTGTFEDLKEQIKKNVGLTVVILTSQNCIVCKRLKVQFPSILNDNPDVNFIEVQTVQENMNVFETLKISTVPHLLYYKGLKADGSLNEVAHLSGFNPNDIRMKIMQFI